MCAHSHASPRAAHHPDLRLSLRYESRCTPRSARGDRNRCGYCHRMTAEPPEEVYWVDDIHSPPSCGSGLVRFLKMIERSLNPPEPNEKVLLSDRDTDARQSLFCKADPNHGLRRFPFLGLHP